MAIIFAQAGDTTITANNASDSLRATTDYDGSLTRVVINTGAAMDFSNISAANIANAIIQLPKASSDYTFTPNTTTGLVDVLDGTTIVAQVPVATDSTTSSLSFTDGQSKLTVAGDGSSATLGTLTADDNRTDGGGSVVTNPEISVTGPASVSEGETASFTVALANQEVNEAYTVDVALAGANGATVGTDFASALTLDSASEAAGITFDGTTLTFPANSSVTSVTLTAAVNLDGTSPETDEGLTVSLSNVTGTDAQLSSSANSVTTSITDVPLTFSFQQTSAEAREGESVTYEVVASAPVDTETVVAFTVVPGDATAANQGTNNTNLNDFDAGSFNPSNVTIAVGETTAQFTVAATNDGITELPEDYTVTAEVNGETFTVTTSLLDGALGTTQSFTSSTDTLSGGNGDDIANGVLQLTASAAVTGTTIAPGDSFAGGAGDDTLNISVAGGLTGTNNYTLNAVTTSDTESLFVSNFATQANAEIVEVDTQLMPGLQTVGLSSSAASGDTKFSKLASIVDGVMSNGAGDLTLDYNSSVTSGTSDTQKVTVSNLTGGIFNADAIETIEIMSQTAGSTLTGVTSNDLTSLTITGDKSLKITNSLDFDETLATGTIQGTVDASANTGGVTIDLNTAENHKVTGGSGNDAFTFGTNLTKDDIIDGGAGTDTLSVNADTFTLASNQISNVEVIQAEATNNNDLSVVTGGDANIASVVLVENDTTGKALSVSDLNETASVSISNNVDGQAVGAVTLGLNDASGSSDALTVNLLGTATHGAADNTIASITTSAIETMNLVSGHNGTTVLGSADTNTVTSLIASGLKTLNLSGEDPVNVTAAATTSLTTVDGSAMTDNMTFSAVNVTSDTTIKGGSGNDIISMGTKLNNADTIDGGANTGATGTDRVTATVTGATTTTGALNIANVEDIRLTNTGTATINATNITGTTAISFEGNGTNTVTGLGTSATIGLHFPASTNNTNAGTVDVKLADESGSSDSLTVNLNATGGNANGGTLKTTAIETVNLALSTTDDTIDDYTLNVSNTKAATIKATGADADTTNVLALGTLNSATTSLDASGFNGLLSVTASSSATTISIKNGAAGNTIAGGAGNDTVNISSLAAAEDASGGTGTNTLNATVTGNFTEATTNFATINYTIADNKTVTVTGANGAGIDTATTFNLKGGNAISTFTHDLVSPASLTKYDMSGFTGSTTALTIADDQLVDTLVITGSAGTDTITATYDTAATYTPKVTAVETLNLPVDQDASGAETYTFALSSATVSNIAVSNPTNADTVNFTSVPASPKFTLGTAVGTEFFQGSTLNVTLASATGTSDALTLSLVDTGDQASTGTASTVTASGVEAVTLELGTTGTESHNLDVSGIAPTSGSNLTYTITGGVSSDVLTIGTLASATNTIDASASASAVIMNGSNGGTTAMTITGSGADDTLVMANASDVIDAGSGNDTLTVLFTSVIGGMEVDLNATGDQVTTFNGSANSASQGGFVHADLSGYTGNGAQVTANASGSTIIGTNSVDSITLGAGSDKVAYDDAAQFTTSDTITGFTVGSDDFQFLGSLLGDGNTTVVYDEDTAVDADANGEVNVVTNALANDAAIIAAIQTSTATTASVFIVRNTADNETQMWYDNNPNVDGNEVQIATIVGITDLTTFASTDFVFV